jgi:tripartite-type tricarboxylate transporter receptor subunit TctC
LVGGENLRTVLLIVVLLVSLLQSAIAEARLDEIAIVVPGAENGGFDRTAVSIKRALIKESLVKEVTSALQVRVALSGLRNL